MKTIILEFAFLAYSLLFTVVCTVGTISVFKETLHKRFDDSGDEDFEDSLEDRTEYNAKMSALMVLLIIAGFNISGTVNYIIWMIRDIFM